MKVLHVITTLQTGGVEKLMVDLLPRLNRLGIESDLLVFDGARTHFFDKLEEAGVNIFSGPAGSSVYHPSHILRIRKLMKGYDIIHTHNSSPQIFGSVASLGKKVRLITTEHTTYNRRRKGVLMRRMDRSVYKKYDKITCVSTEVEHKLREHIGPSRAKDIVTIYNGIDVDKYRNAKPSKELLDYSEEHGNPVLLIMVAAFRRQKDQETLIKALSYLPENYHLVLVGTGERESICKSWAYDLGLKDRVLFMGQRNDVHELLKAAYVSVLSTHYEGFALAAVEGMAAGLPMILTDVEALHEVAGDAARFVRPGDAVTLASEIRRIVENKELREQLIHKGQQRVERYRLDSMARRFADLYRNLLSGKPVSK